MPFPVVLAEAMTCLGDNPQTEDQQFRRPCVNSQTEDQQFRRPGVNSQTDSVRFGEAAGRKISEGFRLWLVGRNVTTGHLPSVDLESKAFRLWASGRARRSDVFHL